MNTNHIGIGAGAVIVALAGFFAATQEDSKPSVVLAERSTSAAPRAPASPPAATPSTQPAVAAATSTASRGVANVDRIPPQSTQFFAATDLKQVVDNARSDPAAGSYYYASLALRECESTLNARLTAPAAAADLGGPEREAMLVKAQERCRNVDDEKGKLLRKLGDEGLAAGDAVFALVTPLSSTVGQRQSPEGLLNAVYGTSDAGAMVTVLNELALRSDSLQVGGRPMNEVEKSSLPAALLMLACDMGVPCDDRHPLVRFHCMAHGRCEANLPTLLQRYDITEWIAYTRGSRFDYQTALSLRRQLAVGIARGDRSVLRFTGG